MARGRLMRSTENRMVAGVAAGVAAHFDLDPTLVRAVWAASILFAGFGLLPYIILWIALPEGESARVPSALAIAEERFARGEITADELRAIREELRR
ncbi:MAG: PspC domain-containing protein [Actinomycetota bacterium]